MKAIRYSNIHENDYLFKDRSLGKVSKKKKLVEISTKGWVGGSGGGQFPLKKNKKNMPLKSILGHFEPF